MRHTKSAPTSGMHHCSLSQGLISFFLECVALSRPRYSRPIGFPLIVVLTVALSNSADLPVLHYKRLPLTMLPLCHRVYVSPLDAGFLVAQTLLLLPQTSGVYDGLSIPLHVAFEQPLHQDDQRLLAAGYVHA